MKARVTVRLVGLLLVALAVVLLAEGCSRGAAASAGLKGSLTYWYGQDFDEANQALVAAFAKAYPNVTVTATGFVYDTYVEKVRVTYAGGAESDVQQIFGDWAADLMKNKRLSPVPPAYAASLRTRLYPTALAGYTYNGALYGVPREYNIESGGVLYYPEDLGRVGYSAFPATWDQMVDAARKLTKYDAKGVPVHWGFDFMTTDNTAYLFLSLVLQQGGSYWAADKVHVTFATPEARTALQAMADLVLRDKVTEVNHLGDTNNDASTYFFKGTSSMLFRGPWVIPIGKNDFGLDNYAYGAMPPFKGTSRAFAAESGWGEVVSARARDTAAAHAFVQFITSVDSMRGWNETTYTIPADKTIAESEEFLQTNPLIKASLDALPFGQPIGPLMSIDTFKAVIFTNNFTSLCLGKQDVAATLEAIERETNAMIDEKRAQ
jgi:multiple sugar transport system substrate-binding protein